LDIVQNELLLDLCQLRTQVLGEVDTGEGTAGGEEHVDVFSIDGLPVGGIRDFDPQGKTGFWITKCAMDYYDIKLRVFLP
jgi:hypothetical protein